LSCYLYRVTNMELVSVFCMHISSFPSNICWRGCLFPIICFWHLCQKSGGHRCVDLYMGLYFILFIDLHICICAGTMLFLLLCLYSIAWNWVLWYFQCFSFLLSIALDVCGLCASKWTLGLIFQSLWWLSLEFWCRLHWTCRLLLVIKDGWLLSQTFSESIEMLMWFSSLVLLPCHITLIDLHMLNHSCIPIMKSIWSWCIIFLCVLEFGLHKFY
jgi:hypothetical protein